MNSICLHTLTKPTANNLENKMASNQRRALFVLTNHDQLGSSGKKTGEITVRDARRRR